MLIHSGYCSRIFSSDLAASDFYLFRFIKEALKRQKFLNDNEVKDVAHGNENSQEVCKR